MQIKELGHVVFFVRDLEKSVNFYGNILGFKQIDIPMRGGALFSSGRTHHEMLLIEVGPHAALPPKGPRAGLYHIGLKIGDTKDELRAAKTELEEAGVTIVGMSDHTVTNSLYLLDPDGNEIELYVDVNKELWQKDPTLIASPTKPLYL
ncbi:MAG: Glyoxalase/bleomycin resistance protein/dioxygenase [Chloroflexi bacterium]|jgi:catechol-2,3-dioxygenase|nr:Glyoxalase/bleomycin resistance protein/dioxygenase [Chloroflexota bacterium]